MTCTACSRGDGPWSLHHWDDDGCDGTFGGATFTLEPMENGDGFHVRRIEPVTPDSGQRGEEE